MPPFTFFLAVVVALVWGGTFVFIKWGVEAFPPLTFAALRFAFALAAISVDLPLAGRGLEMDHRHRPLFGRRPVRSAVYRHDARHAAGTDIRRCANPCLFTVLFAIVFLKERPRWQNIAGLALAFVGVAVIAGNLGAVPLLPFLCVIGGAACWGVSNILTRQAGADNALRLIVWAAWCRRSR